MIRWTGLAPWQFQFPFPGSLTSTFLIPDKKPFVQQQTDLKIHVFDKIRLYDCFKQTALFFIRRDLERLHSGMLLFDWK